MNRSLAKLEHCSRPVLIVGGTLMLAGIGWIDYLTGSEIMFSVFYLLEVGLAAWYLGKGYGLFMSVLSVAVWVVGDLAAGARYSSSFIPIWNALILTAFYFVVVVLLTSLRAAQRELEKRVEQRTEALTREMAERKRLEKEMLQMSERDQHRLGLDLHDGLCQHLTATALAGQVLVERLAAKSLGEAADANQIVGLVEDGISMARNLARGLYPVELEADGLMSAFQELAESITQGAKVACVFDCAAPVLIRDDTVGTHLYRIA